MDNPEKCAKTFFSNKNVGFILFSGIVLAKYLSENKKDGEESHHKTEKNHVTVEWKKISCKTNNLYLN